jgi:hypothetical protein
VIQSSVASAQAHSTGVSLSVWQVFHFHMVVA